MPGAPEPGKPEDACGVADAQARNRRRRRGRSVGARRPPWYHVALGRFRLKRNRAPGYQKKITIGEGGCDGELVDGRALRMALRLEEENFVEYEKSAAEATTPA